jgi:hypothetical protein
VSITDLWHTTDIFNVKTFVIRNFLPSTLDVTMYGRLIHKRWRVWRALRENFVHNFGSKDLKGTQLCAGAFASPDQVIDVSIYPNLEAALWSLKSPQLLPED